MRWQLGVILWASVCFGQQYEIGASIGYGVYRNATVYAPAGTATAGFTNRFTAGAVLGEDLYEHISGELRYLYQDGDSFVSGAGAKANVQGQSHAVHYDLLFHIFDRDARLRPYFAIGGGIKYFRSTGPVPVVQPLVATVVLTNQSEYRPLVTAGFGVKYRLEKHLLLRADFRDYITPFPKKLFLPPEAGTDRGIFHQFTPMIGVSYWF